MTKVHAKALHTVHFAEDGKQVVKTPLDKPFKLEQTVFDEFEAMHAVRKATKADLADDGDADEVAPPEDPGVNLLDRTFSTEEVAAFAPKHRGGGKYVVVLGDATVSEGDDGQGFDKAGAEAWIVEQRKLHNVSDDLLS